MRNILILLGSILLGALSAGAVTLQVSTFTPDPGQTIDLWAADVPLGAEFIWDLDGDGVADRVTEAPRIRWTVPQGAHEVRLTVKRGDTVIASIAALIVADPVIACWQTVRPSTGGALEVTVTFRAKGELSAPGLELAIPPEWGWGQVLEPMDLYKTKGGMLTGTWARQLRPGDEVTFRYLIHPPSPGAAFVFTGKATAYIDGRYHTVPIAGIIGP
ncbi:MAG: hypothetical protein GXO72_00345 [Caldiserica bacterium]|nr:hypothetical protein [Caldisericota bacterium]